MQRVTITMPDETLERVRRGVRRGAAPSVSAYLTQLADQGTREHDLRRLLDELDIALGAPGEEAVSWARSVLDDAR